MSEPIRTVAELVRACKNLTLSSWDVLALKHAKDARNLDLEQALSVVRNNIRRANRILDYLGLDYCRDGETPRECIEREREAADDSADVRGALIDAGNVPVGDETSLADGVRQLTAERDRYSDALVRVAQLWRNSARPGAPMGSRAGHAPYRIDAKTSQELQRLLIAAGLDPDTLGVE